MLPPCRAALPTRLARVRSSRRGSTATSALLSMRSPASSRPGADPTSDVTTSPRSRRCRSAASVPDSRRDTSRRSSTSRRSRATWRRTSAGTSPSSSSSVALTRPVTGVRSSWATSAVKARSVAIRRCRTAAMSSMARVNAATSSLPPSWTRVSLSRARLPTPEAARRSRRDRVVATSQPTTLASTAAASSAPSSAEIRCSSCIVSHSPSTLAVRMTSGPRRSLAHIVRPSK